MTIKEIAYAIERIFFVHWIGTLQRLVLFFIHYILWRGGHTSGFERINRIDDFTPELRSFLLQVTFAEPNTVDAKERPCSQFL